jgi:hypothetical protein
LVLATPLWCLPTHGLSHTTRYARRSTSLDVLLFHASSCSCCCPLANAVVLSLLMLPHTLLIFSLSPPPAPGVIKLRFHQRGHLPAVVWTESLTACCGCRPFIFTLLLLLLSWCYSMPAHPLLLSPYHPPWCCGSPRGAVLSSASSSCYCGPAAAVADVATPVCCLTLSPNPYCAWQV